MELSIDSIDLIGFWTLDNLLDNKCCVCHENLMIPSSKQQNNCYQRAHKYRAMYKNDYNLIQLFKCGHASHITCNMHLRYQCGTPLCNTREYCIISPNVIKLNNDSNNKRIDILQLCKNDDA